MITYVDVPVAAPVVAPVVVPLDPVVAGAEEPDTAEVAGAVPPELSGWPTQLELAVKARHDIIHESREFSLTTRVNSESCSLRSCARRVADS
jgi:hypothetical protein